MIKRLALSVFLALAPPAMAESWHKDSLAGVKFPVPFDVYETKTSAQVQALINDQDRGSGIPPGVTYTSGVYSRAGVPFVLVWTRQEANPPTREELAQLSDAQAAARFGLDELRFDQATMRGYGRTSVGAGLKSRLLVQLARDADIYVGFFYDNERDAAQFDRLAAGFEVTTDKSWLWQDLPRGWRWAVRAGAAALAFALGAGGYYWYRLRLGRLGSGTSGKPLI